MAESAICFLVDQLTIWLQQEQEMLDGVDDDLEWIRIETGQMKAFLKVADEKEESHPQLKELVTQVRELAYDIEDVHDEYMYRLFVSDAKGMRDYMRKLSFPLKKLIARHHFASKMQAIKSRVENASKSWQRYNIDQGATSITNTWYDSRGDALLLEAADLVGIERRKKVLLRWLLPSNGGLKVISVVGMGGLGKTTLVKKVYGDASLKANFNSHVWVTVSQSFKVEDLLWNIIKQLLEEIKQPLAQELEAMNIDEMKEFINDFLQHKTYIIVLDDVWRLDEWETLRLIFPSTDTEGCGRIIITTRSNEIADSASEETNEHVYKLEPLSVEESKKLFYSKTFQGYPCPSYLKETCESILRRCAGLPLAIVVIGGVLANKNNSIEEWDLLNRSLGHKLEGDNNLKGISKILSLSYLDLPPHLKSCFLYLSIFPEDALIEKWRLIRLWIAEGFVLANQGMTSEEVAEGYLRELLDRNLIQVATLSYDGRPKEFHIHDIVRECMILKSREQNIVSTYGGPEAGWPKKIRRIVTHNTMTDASQGHNFKYLRSLLLSTTNDSELESFSYETVLGGCRLLKVLDMRGATLNTIPKEVFKLYNLKYLSMRNTKVESIPKSIQNLKHLETLDLKESNVTKLPKEILKLQRLRHLLVYSSKEILHYLPFHCKQGFKAPYELGSLSSLQKLMYIDADEIDGVKVVREIGKLIHLRRLGIMKLRREDGKDLCSSLAKLGQLRSLNLFAVEEDEKMDLDYPLSLPFLRTLVLHGGLEKTPRWVRSLDRLTVLHLRWSNLKEDPLRRLQGLPNLVVLNMDWAYEGEELVFKDGGFPRLKELLLQRLRKLRQVKVEKGSMPLLEKLYLTACKLMTELPIGIEHLINLQYVDFSDTDEAFLVRLVDQIRKDTLSLPPLKLGLTSHNPLVWKFPETTHIIRLLSKK